MEQGSILQETLSNSPTLANTLTVSVYVVLDDAASTTAIAPSSSTVDEQERIQQIGVDLNQRIQDLEYPWFTTAPTFILLGPSSSAKKKSLSGSCCWQATCNYGYQVTDEWQLIRVAFEYSHHKQHIAIECWDADDGSILLIESAHVLPDWVDEVDGHYRCWIYQGQIRLIPPSLTPTSSTKSSSRTPSNPSNSSSSSSLTAEQALQYLQQERTPHNPELVATERQMTSLIQDTIQKRVIQATHSHRAIVAVPRSVAVVFLHQHPQFVGKVVQAFVEHSHNYDDNAYHKNTRTKPGVSSLNDDDDDDDEMWVWTTHNFGRTHYAMLRNTVKASWPSSDFIPPKYQKSIQRLLLSQAPATESYLHHAVTMGVRLTAGLDYLIEQNLALNTSTSSSTTDAWNQFQLDLQTYRSTSGEEDGSCSTYFSMDPPTADLTESEDWMTVSDEEMQNLASNSFATKLHGTTHAVRVMERPVSSSVQELETVADGVQSFFAGTSDVKGVTTQIPSLSSDSNPLPPLTRRFNPVVLLNLLHATLQAPTAEALQLPLKKDKSNPNAEGVMDPFFSEQDYRDFDLKDDNADSESDDHDDNNEDDSDDATTMKSFMQAMDDELKRSLDVDAATEIDPETAESLHLLSNLLRSLESSSGNATGPLQSMLHEMGIQPPDVRSD